MLQPRLAGREGQGDRQPGPQDVAALRSRVAALGAAASASGADGGAFGGAADLDADGNDVRQVSALVAFDPLNRPGPEVAAHGRTLADLGLVYLRHNGAPRALVLGISALAMGDTRPGTVLMVAEALLRAGDPAQTLAVLERLDHPGGAVDPAPDMQQMAAAQSLAARAFSRTGDDHAARQALLRMAELSAELDEAMR